MTTITLDQDDLALRFRFLDQVREDGAINMMGAASTLTQMFDDDRDLAKAVHVGWLKSFIGGSDADDRARKVLAEQAAAEANLRAARAL